MDETKKTLAVAVNRTAKDIAMLAMSRDYTKEASQLAIEQIGNRQEVDVFKTIKISSGAGGAKRLRFKAGSKWKSSPDIGTFKLANWIMKNQGLPPLGNTKIGIPGIGFGKSSGKQGTIGRIAKNLVAARKRSVQFLGVGWAAAARVFGKRPSKGDFGDKTIARIGGGVKAQTDKAITEGVIFNNTGTRDIRYFPVGKRSPSGISKIGMPGLMAAMNEVLNDPKRGIIPYIKARLDRLPLGRRGLYG